MKRILVVAPNKRYFRSEMEAKTCKGHRVVRKDAGGEYIIDGHVSYMYVNSPEKLRGLIVDGVIIIGPLSEQSQELYKEAMMRVRLSGRP